MNCLQLQFAVELFTANIKSATSLNILNLI